MFLVAASGNRSTPLSCPAAVVEISARRPREETPGGGASPCRRRLFFAGLVSVPVVNIRRMAVHMDAGFVNVLMGMPAPHRRIVHVVVMKIVVQMGMVVLQTLMSVAVDVLFPYREDYSPHHQRGGKQEVP